MDSRTVTPRPGVSPRLVALRAAVAAAAAGSRAPRAVERVLDEFWTEAAIAGTPLVEPAAGEATDVAVTFLRRSPLPDDGPDVLVVVDTLTDRHRDDLRAARLERVEGTDVLARTYLLAPDHRASYGFYADAHLADDAGRARATWRSVLDGCRPDPLNARRITSPGGRTGSVLALPDAPGARWDLPRPDGVPRGTVDRHRLSSAHLGAERDVWLYTPALGTLEPGRPLATLVLLDGGAWAEFIGDVLDVLIADGTLPPLVAVLPHCGDGPDRPATLGLNPALPLFVTEELLPWAANRIAARLGAASTLDADPSRVVVAGQSLGGLAALQVGFRSPHRVGNVLAQSGAFWWPEDDDGHPLAPGTEALTAEIAASARAPLRVRQSVGTAEWMLLGTNHALHEVLVGRGYDATLSVFAGGHDYACWRADLAEGLVALLGANASASSPDRRRSSGTAATASSETTVPSATR